MSSRETSIKGDLNVGSFSSLSDLANLANLGDLASLRNNFNYNTEAARALATRSVVPPQSYGFGTNNNPTGTTSPGTFGNVLDYRAPPYPYKLHRYNMQPWVTGYGKDCVDYTFPSCNSYSMSSADNATSPRTGGASSVSTDHRTIAYQPWDSRGRQYSADTETLQTMMPPSAAFLTANMPSNVSPRPSQHADMTVALKTTVSETSGPANINTVIDTAGVGSSSKTSLAYRSAPGMGGSVYNHSSAKPDDNLIRNSIEMDRIPSETLISLPRYKVCDPISRSSAPSPIPDSRVMPHFLSHLATQSIPHTAPDSVPSSLFNEMPHSVTSSVSQTLPQRVVQATAQAMPSLSTYAGHNTTDSDHIAALNYSGANCSNSIVNFAYENYHSSASNQVGHFNELDSNAGTHVINYSPSASAAYHENYTHEPGFKIEAEHGAVSIVCPQSNETVIPATSTEHIARMTSTHTARVYSPAERPNLLPISRTPTPKLNRESHQDTRCKTICVGDREQKSLAAQHTPTHSSTGTQPRLI